MIRNVYSLFGNPIRNQLILCLAKRQKNVTELIGTCGLSQSAVSQHLAKLKRAGIVETRKQGKTVWYSLKYKQAADITSLLQKFQQEVR